MRERNVELRLDHELRAIRFADDGIAELDFGADTIDARAPMTPSFWRCPAMPPRRWFPNLTVPQGHRAIANAHFRIAVPPDVPPMLGVINGTTEWIFAFAGRLSVTISNADRLMDVPRAMLAQIDLAGGVPRDGNCRRTAAVADRPRAAGDLRGHAGGERQAPRRADAMG